MHLLAAKLAALLSLTALRLPRFRMTEWFMRFSFWRLRQEFPTELREFPDLPPSHPLYWLWVHPSLEMAMALMQGDIRHDASDDALTLDAVGARRTLDRLRQIGYGEAIEAVRPLARPLSAWLGPSIKEHDMQERTRADAYADILAAIFSLAAINHGHERTPVAEFHRLLVALRDAFPNDMPSFDVVGRPPFQSSELLSDALHRALCADPPAVLHDGADLVVDRRMAMRNMARFDPFSRSRFVRNFSRIADRFVALQRARDDGPTGAA